jgi:hypothetical protein
VNKNQSFGGITKQLEQGQRSNEYLARISLFSHRILAFYMIHSNTHPLEYALNHTLFKALAGSNLVEKW